MSLDAYKVAVQISLIDNVTAGLASLSRHFTAANKSASELQTRLDGIKKTAMLGGALVAGGAFGLKALQGPLEEAKKFQQEANKFSTLGFGDAINAQAEKAARGMKTIGTSATDNMALLGDAMAVFKDFHEATFAAPIMAKMKFANEVLFHGQGGERDSKLMDMLKVGELRGGTASAEAMQNQAEFAQKVIEGSRNRVDPTAMLQAMKYGGIATRMMSDRAFYLRSEPLIQEVGGAGFGTGVAAMYSNLAQGRGSLSSQQELYRLGLMDKSKVEFNNQGALKKALPGAFLGESAFKGGVEEVGNYLLKAFAAKGITKNDDVLREIGMVMSNQRGARLLAAWYQQREKIAMQGDANEKAMGLDDAVKKANSSLLGQELSYEKQLANLKLELGQNILPLAIDGLKSLNAALKAVTNFTKEFPRLTNVIMITGAVLSGLLVVGGSVLLLKASLGALGIASQFTVFGVGVTGMMGKIGTLAKLLGPIGLGLAAGVAVIEIGRLVGAAKELWDINHREGVKLSGAAAARLNDPSIQSQLSGFDADFKGKGSPYVKTSHSQTIQVSTQLNMDGRKVASLVSMHQGREAARPLVSGSQFDSNMNLLSPSFGK